MTKGRYLARSDSCRVWHYAIKRRWSSHIMLGTANQWTSGMSWYRLFWGALWHCAHHTQVRTSRLGHLRRGLGYVLHVGAARHHCDLSAWSWLFSVVVLYVAPSSFVPGRRYRLVSSAWNTGGRIITTAGDARRATEHGTHFPSSNFSVQSWGGGFALSPLYTTGRYLEKTLFLTAMSCGY